MSRLKYFVLLIINTLGIAVSVYSLVYTERMNSTVLTGHLICDLNKTVSCTATYISQYAFIGNIPVSFFAVLFFWFIVSILAMNWNKDAFKMPYQFILVLNLIAIFVCCYYLSILIFVLRTVCVTCLTIDSIVIINFILLFGFYREIFHSKENIFKKFLVGSRIPLLSFVLLIGSGLIVYEMYLVSLQKNDKTLMEEFFRQKPISDISCESAIVWGNRNAKVTIRIFNDFQCPYCKIASERYREILKGDSSNVKVEFICYPLHYENKKKEAGNLDILLSKVMLAAADDERFWNLHDIILKKSRDTDSTEIFMIAKKTLSDYEHFDNNLFNNNYDDILKSNIAIAKEYKISGTPSIFINGRAFDNWTNIRLLKLILRSTQNSNP